MQDMVALIESVESVKSLFHFFNSLTCRAWGTGRRVVLRMKQDIGAASPHHGVIDVGDLHPAADAA